MTSFDEKAALEWIRKQLNESGLRQEDLARAWGKGDTENPGSYVSKTLSGERKLKLQEFFIAKEFFGEPVVSDPIPVRGKVGAGGHVHGLDAGVMGEVDNPGGQYPLGTSALEVDGDSMGALIPNRSFIFYDTIYESPLDLHINQICVIWCADGRSLVKRLLRGARKDRWSLLSLTDGTVEENVFIDYVAKVTGVKFN